MAVALRKFSVTSDTSITSEASLPPSYPATEFTSYRQYVENFSKKKLPSTSKVRRPSDYGEDYDHDKQVTINLDEPKVTSSLSPTAGGQTTEKLATSMEDITSLHFWKCIVAELVGTLLLTLIGCGSCVSLRDNEPRSSHSLQVALCFGLSVATVVWAIAHVSGGHINPAVTVAMLVTRKISLAKAIFYVLCQLTGAMVGAAILMGLTPARYHGDLGMTLVSNKISLEQAVGVELFITFLLVLTVFASCDRKRKDLNGSAPLAIGLSVTMCHLWAIDYTGASMNTARSFGPALVIGTWDNHWVYWVGPVVGGVVAGVLYEHLFAVNASLAKAKACLLSSDYDDNKHKANKIKIRVIEEDPNEEQPMEEEHKLTTDDTTNTLTSERNTS